MLNARKNKINKLICLKITENFKIEGILKK